MRRLEASLAALFLLGAPAALGAPEASDESTCVSCHLEEEGDVTEAVVDAEGTLRVEFAFSAPTHEWRESIHAAHEVSCDGCHGGDPHEPDEDLSMSEEAGFLENPSWTEMGQFCGVCHEAAAASYAQGAFGRAMNEGVRVATCDTCHMADGHRIVAARPEELLAAERCGSCLRVADAQALVGRLAELRALHLALAGRVGAVEARGLELADVGEELARVRSSVTDAVHGFEPAAIRRAGDEARARYQELTVTTAAAEDQLASRLGVGLVLAAALALLFAALLFWDRMLRGAP